MNKRAREGAGSEKEARAQGVSSPLHDPLRPYVNLTIARATGDEAVVYLLCW